jgi:hypothetical protein
MLEVRLIKKQGAVRLLSHSCFILDRVSGRLTESIQDDRRIAGWRGEFE